MNAQLQEYRREPRGGWLVPGWAAVVVRDAEQAYVRVQFRRARDNVVGLDRPIADVSRSAIAAAIKVARTQIRRDIKWMCKA